MCDLVPMPSRSLLALVHILPLPLTSCLASCTDCRDCGPSRASTCNPAPIPSPSLLALVGTASLLLASSPSLEGNTPPNRILLLHPRSRPLLALAYLLYRHAVPIAVQSPGRDLARKTKLSLPRDAALTRTSVAVPFPSRCCVSTMYVIPDVTNKESRP